MDFDLTKENIQPLRGGRNPQQLVMALQAQTNQEYQMQLQQQRQEFEMAIRNYQGNDPLEAFYNYICWVEQSYPKHGHEGNLIELLEHCLRLFENDSRYVNDRRFCKLWIKYFDHLPNPLELYHMLYAKGLCKGCTDFYKAWAYYYEATEDFQNAHNVFEEGKRNLAQPHEELLTAQKNLVLATGEHILYGRDEEKLAEKRQALTSLITYRPGRVSSVRVPSANGSVVLPNTQGMQQSRGVNIPVPVFEDRGRFEMAGAAAVPPVSIIEVAKRQEAPKENTMKPGPWTTVPVKKRVLAQKTSSAVKVYEEPDTPNFPAETQERYLDWAVSIRYPEENVLPNGVPMYPKARVYSDPSTEYSIEELRAMRYHRGRRIVADVAGPSESILVDDDEDYLVLDDMAPAPQVPDQIFQDPPAESPAKPNISIPKVLETNSPHLFGHMSTVYPSNTTCLNNTQSVPQLPGVIANDTLSRSMAANHSVAAPSVSPVARQSVVMPPEKPKIRLSILDDDDDEQEEVYPWSPLMQPKVKQPSFTVFEQSMQEMPPSLQAKGSAMKTAFRTLTTDDFVETGSRGGMDGAAAAQPTDGARPMPLFSDNSSSSFEDAKNCDFTQDLNTQQFNLNLKEMQVSTPQAKRPVMGSMVNEEELQGTRKQLFLDNKGQRDQQILSTILEESKGSVSSSSSSGATTKSSLFGGNSHTAKMTTISEEHNSYLEQNLMANAALRASLLGDIMDFKSEAAAPSDVSEARDEPVLMQASPIVSPVRKIPAPAVVKPLDSCPSDPFKSHVISQLLERVKFPGPHTQGYILLNNTPRLVLTKKDPIFIGNEQYFVEKQLGKGTFGTVYKAINCITNQQVALKFQRPSNKWEFYICREIQARLVEHPLRNRFMDVTTAYFSDQASILVSEYMPFGSLLDAANMYKTKSGGRMKEMTCIYFTFEMMNIIKAMHEINIIHADIKPDNFLVFLGPDNMLHLQLIDFGCSIDMTLYPPNAAFKRVVTTEDFICCEMREGRPWNYHTDLFCIAATSHVLLFDKYIQLRQADRLWSITNRVPRYMKVDLWNMFFSNLLNQQTGPADLATLLFLFNEELEKMKKDLPGEIRYMTNILSNR